MKFTPEDIIRSPSKLYQGGTIGSYFLYLEGERERKELVLYFLLIVCVKIFVVIQVNFLNIEKERKKESKIINNQYCKTNEK